MNEITVMLKAVRN